MKVNKKFFAAVLSMVMVAFSMTTCSAAESSDEWKNNTGTIKLDSMTVSGDGVSVSGDTVTITKGGDFEVTGTLDDGMIYVKSDEKVKLRLSGMSITNSDGPAIFFDNVEKGFITITENTENYLADGKEYATEDADATLFSNDDLEIKGNGTLTVTGNYKHGIASDDDLSIENGTIIINSYEHGIKVNNALSILGGDITVKAETGKGMKAGEEVLIEDGDIKVTSLESEGIESKGTLTINGGNLDITAKDDGINAGNADTGESFSGTGGSKGDFGGRRDMSDMNGGTPPNMDNANGGTPPENFDGGQRPERPADMNGGTPPNMDNANGGTPPENFGGGQRPERPADMNGENPPSTDNANGGMPNGGGRAGGAPQGAVNEETAAAHAITINGGSIYVNAEGDGIDSNGNLIINGGEITVDGPTGSGNGPIDSDGTVSINGGTVVLASSAGMVQLPRSSDGQNILSVIFSERQSAGAEVTVRETQSGDVLVSHKPAKEFQAFVYSSDKIKVGTEYTVSVNGSDVETVTAVQGTTSAGLAAVGGGRGMGGFGGRGGFGTGMGGGSRIRVNVDGRDIRFDTSPIIKNDTTLVGFRAVCEALRANVEWDGENEVVTAEKDGTRIVLKIGSTTAEVNGEEKALLLAPEIINDSTMIPVRFLSEQLGMNVDWNDAAQLITITSK
ncbi:MAG: carbohydrate-binding domain-containing protein [Monoglobaceae bacterium]